MTHVTTLAKVSWGAAIECAMTASGFSEPAAEGTAPKLLKSKRLLPLIAV